MSTTEYAPKMNVLMSFLGCSLHDADIMTLHQHHMDKSRTTATYSQCVRNTTMREFESRCLRPLIDICRKSEVSLVKTIRSKMEAMEELLHRNSDLKIIHLVRDPRATLFSRTSLPKGFDNAKITKQIFSQAFEHCHRVLRDVQDTIRLSKLYPGRVALLLYEKLANAPLNMTKLIYKFLGLTLTRDTLSYVYNITSAGLPDTCVVCTQRKNSTETANRWRADISFQDVLSMDKSCSALNNRLGYQAFRHPNEVHNLSVPSWRERHFYPMLTDRYSYKNGLGKLN